MEIAKGGSHACRGLGSGKIAACCLGSQWRRDCAPRSTTEAPIFRVPRGAAGAIIRPWCCAPDGQPAAMGNRTVQALTP